jgi:hypothetical protein
MGIYKNKPVINDAIKIFEGETKSSLLLKELTFKSRK